MHGLKFIFISAGVLVVVYTVLCFYLWAWQRNLIFEPQGPLTTTPGDYGLSYEDVYLRIDGRGTTAGTVHGWWVPCDDGGGSALLYLHGSALNISANVEHVKRFHGLGFSVLIIDYRGYGKSRGAFPSEQRVYEDAEAAWHHLIEKRQPDPEKIFIYGHSLGGAVAVQLALSRPEVGGLIIESTFTSIADVARLGKPYRIFPVDWILNQRFDSVRKIPHIKVPVLLIHGTADESIPFEMSGELFRRIEAPKKLLLVPGGGHSDNAAVNESLYLRTVRDFKNMAHRLPRVDIRLPDH